MTASHDFNVASTADYHLSLSALSGACDTCDTCVIEYNVLVDGVTIAQNATSGSAELVSLSLINLSAGLHTIELGVTANFSFFGHFYANFDNVAITTTPIPAALPLLASALGGLGFVGWRRRKSTPIAA